MLDRFDYIHLRDITTILPIEPDAWRRTSVLQLAHLTIKIGYPTILLHAAARDDGLDTTLNYSQVYRSVSARIGDHISMQDFMGVPKLAEILLETCVTEVWHCLSSDAAKRIIGKNEIAPLPLELSIRLDKGILRAEKGVTYHFACSHKFADKKTTPQVQLRHVEVSHVKAYCILGVNDCERKARQQVAVTFKLENCQPRLEELQELVEKIGKVSPVAQHSSCNLDNRRLFRSFVRPRKSTVRASSRWRPSPLMYVNLPSVAGNKAR